LLLRAVTLHEPGSDGKEQQDWREVEQSNEDGLLNRRIPW
jgi:hypothetical protein